jgi:hypothetical protein
VVRELLTQCVCQRFGQLCSTAAWAGQVLELSQCLGAGIQRIPVNDLWTLTVTLQPVADQTMIGRRFLAAGHAIQAHRAVTARLEGVRGPGLVVSFATASA